MPQDAATYSSIFETCLVFALVLPLASGLLSRCISDRYAWIVTVAAPLLLLASTVCAAIVFGEAWNNMPYHWHRAWFTLGEYTVNAGVFIDNVAVIMLFVVTFISFLVHVYSTGYMAGDRDAVRYFSMLGIFTFAMLGIVVADSLLLVFVCWELVGFSSYMLIGHWHERPEAATAAKKAFVMNRIGDAGFLVGLMILWTTAGTFDLVALSATPARTVAALCIFAGVVGKSAQGPLLTWLPDAMEGPTPVSALIHAATMVAAGVFLLVRVEFLFTPVSLDVVACVGIVTALVAAIAALAQTDIKKILAYSTISQLGLMITAVGANAADEAMLHLLTHAFFKACLFLGAGSVIHALHQAQHRTHTNFDVQHLDNLGGLRKKLPLTFIAFLLSGSALAGIPFFSGFLSKDALLGALLQWPANTPWRWAVVIVAFAVSFITVLYTFRLIWRVFMGKEHKTETLPVTEPPAVMRWPVTVLAVASLWVIVSWSPLHAHGWVLRSLAETPREHHWLVAMLSAAWVLLALGCAYATRNNDLARAAIFSEGFYLDRLYRVLIIQPSLKLAALTGTVDRRWIDGIIHAAAYVQVSIAHLTGWFDRAMLDGMVNGVAILARGVGNVGRSFQGGKVQLYIFWTALAMIIFLIWTLF